MNKKITFTEALLTAIGMVIGSGIFFRADNILKFTEGNVGIAIIAWASLGFTLIFAGIAMSVLASRSEREGGIVGYMEDVFGEKAAFLTGWFTTFIYIPTLTGILAIVASIFFYDLIGFSFTAVTLHALAAFFIAMVFTWNYFSTKFAALFSSAATVIKLLPIIIVGTIGLTKIDFGVIGSGISAFDMGLFAAPLLSMAFAFDGWTSVATLSRDMENPQRDIAKVLALNAVIVTIAYTLYFTGMTMIFNATPGGMEQIIALGDGHVSVAAQSILGDIGGKLILFTVTMSVLGTLNGNVMAGYRYPHALAQAGNLPNSEFFVQESKYGTTGRAALIALSATAVWFVGYAWQAISKEAQAVVVANEHADLVAAAAAGTINEADQAILDAAYANHMFTGISFDDIPIMLMATLIIILMIGVMKVGPKEGYGALKSYIAPVVGIIGQGYVIYSFIITNPSWLLYMFISVAILAVGYLIRMNLKKKQA